MVQFGVSVPAVVANEAESRHVLQAPPLDGMGPRPGVVVFLLDTNATINSHNNCKVICVSYYIILYVIHIYIYIYIIEKSYYRIVLCFVRPGAST